MTKYYNAETRNSLEMQFGSLVCKFGEKRLNGDPSGL